MRKYFFIAFIVILLVGATVIFTPTKKEQLALPTSHQEDIPATTILAEGLDTPWAIAFLLDNSFLVTERKGDVKHVDTHGQTTVATLPNVQEIGEGGLLGIALHPDFSSNNYVYFYYTYSSSGNNTMNRVVRMTYQDNKLSGEKIILNEIPGASNHNGGRITFGPDNFLYIGTGDAQEPSLAQNTKSLAGKILRVTADGKAAPGNPFNNAVYSYGHRNVQGIAWDNTGSLWATEHGRSGIQSGLDEINIIQAGKNYGWPTIQGNETRAGMETPRKNSENTTWAPAGAAFNTGSLFFGGLRGQTLYKAVIQGDQISTVEEYFNGEYGRIREVILGPDGMIYISTSNNDGRGFPKSGDDKIIKVNPEKL